MSTIKDDHVTHNIMCYQIFNLYDSQRQSLELTFLDPWFLKGIHTKCRRQFGT